VRLVALFALLLVACGGPSFSAADAPHEELDAATDTRAPAPATDTDSGRLEVDSGTAVDSGTSPEIDSDSSVSVPDSSAPTEAEVDACTPVLHSNGLGQSWTDCVPLGTYNEAQAKKACWAAVGPASAMSLCNVTPSCNEAVFYAVGIWSYAGATAGYVSSMPVTCPTVSSPMWD
jgi:hypothetical protein